jgi:hypothetical protein
MANELPSPPLPLSTVADLIIKVTLPKTQSYIFMNRFLARLFPRYFRRTVRVDISLRD